MQAALDSTALMVSKDLSQGLITTSQITAKAQAYFAALYTNTDAQSTAVTATYTASSSMGSTIQVNGTGSITTDFLKVAGFPTLNFNTTSTAAWGNVRMRVAMALDNTGSMGQDGKIGALRTAASSLVDQLSALAKIRAMSTSRSCRSPRTSTSAPATTMRRWIDWTDWDNNNQTCTGNWWNQTCTPKNHNTWTGCVTDRTQPYDTQSTTPAIANVATLFPADD